MACQGGHRFSTDGPTRPNLRYLSCMYFLSFQARLIHRGGQEKGCAEALGQHVLGPTMGAEGISSLESFQPIGE